MLIILNYLPINYIKFDKLLGEDMYDYEMLISVCQRQRLISKWEISRQIPTFKFFYL